MRLLRQAAYGLLGHPARPGRSTPIYYCVAKGCERRAKVIRRDVIESEFEALLAQLTPAPRLLDLARAMFKDAWNQRMALARSIAQSHKRELAKVEGQIAVLLDRIVEATSTTVVAAYEKRIAQLEREKLLLAERSESDGRPSGTFEELFKLAFAFLSNPHKLWASGVSSIANWSCG